MDAIVFRTLPPEPWAEGDKIPWDDPAFSERMLAEHLSQTHDAASRRFQTIDKQVDWIDNTQLKATPGRVLDLGCGPGLYANRLARLGHTVRGIDYAPASIRYAREQAERERLTASYELADIRTADYGGGYDLAMLLYGEVNVFKRDDALAILELARSALNPSGILLIEVHTFHALHSRGQAAPSWHALRSGLFSDRNHLLLEESFWNDERAAATRRWFVVDTKIGACERHVESMQAYTDEEYKAMLEESGFRAVRACANWPAAPGQENLLRAFVANV